MKISDIGVFSPYTLMLHSEGTGESPVCFLKRASIIFERLLLFPLGLGNMGEPDELISKETYLSAFTKEEPSVVGDVCKIVVLHRDLIGDVDSFFEELHTPESDDLWMGDASDKYIDFVRQLVDSTVGS